MMVKTLNLLEKGEFNKEDFGAMGVGEAVLTKMMIPGERIALADIYLGQRADFKNLTTTFDLDKAFEKNRTVVLTPVLYPNFSKALNPWKKSLTGVSALKCQRPLTSSHPSLRTEAQRI